jgi:hypothetical protein
VFVDPDKPRDTYRLTYNLVGSPENQLTFNDGYHLLHHLNSRTHWSELPSQLLASLHLHDENEGGAAAPAALAAGMLCCLHAALMRASPLLCTVWCSTICVCSGGLLHCRQTLERCCTAGMRCLPTTRFIRAPQASSTPSHGTRTYHVGTAQP